MASKADEATAVHDEKHHDTRDIHVIDPKLATGHVTEINAASVALAAAVAAQKPSLWSKNMLKLYFIMGIGYRKH
jgi:hypothetical protein